MDFNFPILLAAALIPMVVGFAWYNPKTFGTAWMQAAEMTEEKMKGANMAVIFGVSYLFSVFIAMAVQFTVVHQYHVYSIFADDPTFMDPTSTTGAFIADFMSKYGNNFRTFKHGALHGFLDGLFFAMPILGVNALFERKGWKYILINGGYWAVCLALMGGVICAFA
ncbi:MAG: DUF1761 domain-containing protein [Lewinellaceae bacterium]|nr:DUF1761 domain-containing protein [Lewinellaceae bacterium]